MLALGTLTPVLPASAAEQAVRKVERHGACQRGAGSWELDVRRRSRRLRVEFEVEDIPRRQRWQVFVSHDGRRIAAVTRRTGVSGELRVRRLTRNRRGPDRISATAVNPRTGRRCSGTLRF